MSFLPETLKRRAFWIVAQTCFKLYGWFPVFGSLRASIAIICREQRILVIRRNDGRGLSLPGGIASWKETEEETLRREVLEETGLTVTHAQFQMKYHSATDVPCNISVYVADVSGEPRDSWEGTPCWMTMAELEPRFMRSQRPVLDLMRKMCAG